MQYIMVNVMESGHMFGEKGLTYNKPRGATCIALTEIELGFIDRVHFQECFSEFIKMEEKRKTNFIESKIVIDQELKFLAPKIGTMFKKKTISRGNFLCRQGKPVETIYFIRSGEVGLRYSWHQIYDTSSEARILKIPYKAHKKTEFFSYLKVGETIGEDCLFTQDKIIDYDVITMTECDLYCIDVEKLNHDFEGNPFIKKIFIRNSEIKQKMIQFNTKCFHEVINYNGVEMFKELGKKKMEELEEMSQKKKLKISKMIIKENLKTPLYKFKEPSIDHTKSRVDRHIEGEKDKIIQEASELSEKNVQMFDEKEEEGRTSRLSFDFKNQTKKNETLSLGGSVVSIKRKASVPQFLTSSRRRNPISEKKKMFLEVTSNLYTKKIVINKRAFEQREILRKKVRRSPMEDIKDFKRETEDRKRRAEIKNKARSKNIIHDTHFNKPYKKDLEKDYSEPQKIVKMMFPLWKKPKKRRRKKKKDIFHQRRQIKSLRSKTRKNMNIINYDYFGTDSYEKKSKKTKKDDPLLDKMENLKTLKNAEPSDNYHMKTEVYNGRTETQASEPQKEIVTKNEKKNGGEFKSPELKKSKSMTAQKIFEGAKSLQHLKWKKDRDILMGLKVRKSTKESRIMMKRKVDFYLGLKNCFGRVDKGRERFNAAIRQGKARSRRYGDDFLGGLGSDDKFRFSTFQQEKR